MPHKGLWVAVSHHGFGHLGQIAPVLNRWVAEHPDFRIVVQSAHPRVLLERFLLFPFQQVERAADQPLIMKNAITLDIPATVAALNEYHSHARAEIDWLATCMQEYDVAVVLSNIGYFPLVAARQAGLPALAFCSLNWADILSAYVAESNQLPEIIKAMTHWYSAANAFFAPTPSMPMPCMNNVITIGPVARGGVQHQLCEMLGYPATTRWGLVSLGGIPYPIDYFAWPHVSGWVWLICDGNSEGRRVRPDILNLQCVNLPYVDVLASVDLLITKPGYGNITEAGCAGIPVACLPRPDWPETNALLQWLQQKVPVLMIEENDLHSGDCLSECARWCVSQHGTRKSSPAYGVAQMVDYLSKISLSKISLSTVGLSKILLR